MKTLFFALLILLALGRGEALKCNYCISRGPDDPCTPTVQSCPYKMDTCANVYFTSGPLPSHSIRSCMNAAVCQGYIQTPGVIAYCCSTDLCN